MSEDFRDRLIKNEATDKSFVIDSSKENHKEKVVTTDHSDKIKSNSHSKQLKGNKNAKRLISKGNKTTKNLAKKKVKESAKSNSDDDVAIEETAKSMGRAGKNTGKAAKETGKLAVEAGKATKEMIQKKPPKKEVALTVGKGLKKGTFTSGKAIKHTIQSEVSNFKGDSSAQGIGEAEQVRDSLGTANQIGRGARKVGRAGAKGLQRSQQAAQMIYHKARQLLSKETAKALISQLAAPLTMILLVVCLFTAVIAGFSILGFGGGDCDTSTNITEITSKDAEANATAINAYIKKEFPESTPQGRAGMLGNFERECRLNPAAVERPGDSLSGHGLAQWTAGRATNLMNFASEHGKEWSDLGLQLAFLVHELKGAESAAVAALKMTDVHQATDAWQLLFERAGVVALDERKAYADKWYAKLGDSDPISEGTLSNGADGELDSLGCGLDADGGEITEIAKSWIGWFKYLQLHPSPDLGSDFKNPNKEGSTDCSGYVWLVLNKAGCKVPPNMGWYTMSMENDAKGSQQYLKEVSESEATAGDVVIVNVGGGAGSNGHTGILAEKWTGNGTKIYQQGGSQSSVNNDAFGSSFTSLLNGGTVTFARPIKAGE